MRYKTKDGQDYSIPGIGRTVNGIIVTDHLIENPNFELVEEAAPAASAPPQPPTLPVETPPVQTPATASPTAPQVNEQKEQN